MKKVITFLLVMVILSVMSNVAFCEDGVSTLNASGTLNRSVSVDPTGRSEGFSAVIYNNLNGLPTSGANAIAETGEGFIWIGSYAGLIRYDGNTFERMDSTNGITSVRSLFVDSRDRLWIGTNANGFAVMNRGEYRIWDMYERLKSSSIRAFAEDDGGNIYVATTSGIAKIDADMNMTMLADSQLENAYIRDLRLGGDGLIYGLTWPGDLFTLRDGKLETWLSRDDCRVQDVLGILPDPERLGDLYLGTSGSAVYHGSFQDNFENAETTDVAPLSYVEGMEYIDGQIWLCAENGIGNINDAGFHRLDNLPMENNVTHVMTDYEGNLWFTSTRQGAMKVVPNQFSNLYERYDLPETVVNATCLLANGELSPVFYNHENGFNAISTANSYCELTAEGDLYISATTGVTQVNIEKPFEDVGELKVAVPYVETDGARVYPDTDGTFTIPKDTQKLTIYSYVFNYLLTNPQVSTRLDGFESQYTTTSRTDMVPVDYTNLRGGTYNFILQLQDAMGRGSKEVSVKIIKEKKLYEETWFLILSGLVLLAVLAIIVRFYVQRKTKKLEQKQKETMALVGGITEAFAKVIDMKDKYTNGHSSRVAKYTAMLAKELGYDEETVEKYYRIALLHDIGKVGVPQEVLNKPGKLTDEEFEIIKSHTSKGYEALKQITIMPELAIGAGAHHERPDGKGYPNHLKGDEIPRVAQIIAVADCFDAMYSNRPYRSRMNFDKVISIIKEVSGTQLTPDVVEAFLRLVDKGEFRDPDDNGGGSTENIENIRK